MVTEYYILQRLTRLHEGPGERFEGRVSATPIIYQVHQVGCDRAPELEELTETQASAIVEEYCRERRHLMTCMVCETSAIAERLKSNVRRQKNAYQD